MSITVRVLWGSAAVTGLVAAVSGWHGLTAPGTDHYLLTASSVLAATAGYLISNAVNLSIKLREKSFEFLSAATDKDRITPSLNVIGKFWMDPKNNVYIQGNDRTAELYFSKVYDASVFDSFRTVANHFEEIAILIKSDAVHEEMLFEYYAGILVRFATRYHIFCAPFRNAVDYEFYNSTLPSRPEVGESVLWLFQRWCPRYLYAYRDRMPRDHVDRCETLLTTVTAA